LMRSQHDCTGKPQDMQAVQDASTERTVRNIWKSLLPLQACINVQE